MEMEKMKFLHAGRRPETKANCWGSALETALAPPPILGVLFTRTHNNLPEESYANPTNHSFTANFFFTSAGPGLFECLI